MSEVGRELLGIEELRPGQRDAVEAVLDGCDTVLVMPTGAGKSAVYEIAGTILAGPTIVISPLIALQRDQVDSIAESSLDDAAAANSTIGNGQRRQVFDRLGLGASSSCSWLPSRSPAPIRSARPVKRTRLCSSSTRPGCGSPRSGTTAITRPASRSPKPNSPLCPSNHTNGMENGITTSFPTSELDRLSPYSAVDPKPSNSLDIAHRKKRTGMRPLKHLTPQFILARVGVILWERRNPKAPWLTAAAVNILAGWLRNDDIVFEWGSGRSTSWFAAYAGRLISVEHDSTWYRSVSGHLGDDGYTFVERHLKETTESTRDESSEAYVAVIDLLDDGHDLVLVDGLHRDECALRSVRKLRPGGLLVVDNADWFISTASNTPKANKLMLRTDGWERFEMMVKGWRRIDTTNGVWDTVIWIKPGRS